MNSDRGNVLEIAPAQTNNPPSESLAPITQIHHIDNDRRAWATIGRRILRFEKGGWQEEARFPRAFPRDCFAFYRPFARAARADKCNVYVNAEGNLLGIRSGTVYTFQGTDSLQPLFKIQGDCVLHGGICEDNDGWSYIGEYFRNKERGPVRIWRVTEEMGDWEVAHLFPAGSVRHVHGVYRDPSDPEALWVTVGDGQDECYLFRTGDRFRSIEQFGDGTQTWRAVRLFFTKDWICWLTDSHISQNHACRMNRRTGELEIGQEIDCSSWYGATTTDGLHVAFTTVEPGPAIHRNQASILTSRDGFHWEELTSFDKDFWRPMRLFKYGVLSCPSGPMKSDSFYISGEGLVGLDGSSIRISLPASDITV